MHLKKKKHKKLKCKAKSKMEVQSKKWGLTEKRGFGLECVGVKPTK